MKTRHFFIMFYLSAGVLFGVVAQSPLTPEQAVNAVETSNDVGKLTDAVIVAARNPATRQAVIDALNDPSRRETVRLYFYNMRLNRLSQPIHNFEELTLWANQNEKLADSMREQWYDAWVEAALRLDKTLAETGDPAMLDVFLATQKSGIWGKNLNGFAEAVPKTSPLAKSYLDYLQKQVLAFEAQLGSRKPAFANDYLRAIVALGTDDAFKTIEQGLATNQYAMDEVIEIFNINLRPIRYDPRVVPLFLAHLKASNYSDTPRGLVDLLFGSDEHRVETFILDPDRQRLYSPPPKIADPKVYPDLLAFIAEAEKYPLPERETKLLADAKAKILALQAKRGNGAAATPAAATSAAPDSVPAPSAIPPAATPKPPAPPAATTPATTPFPTAWAAVAALVLLAGGFALWRFKKR